MRGNLYRWTVGKLVNDVITCGVQALVVKSDQEVSIVDVNSSLTGELRSVQGSTFVSEKPLVSANAATLRLTKAYSTTSNPGRATSTWTLEIAEHVVSRSLSGVSGERTACGRRKRRNCSKALVQYVRDD